MASATKPDTAWLDITQDDIDYAYNHARGNRQPGEQRYVSVDCCAAARAAQRVFQPREGQLVCVTPSQVRSEGLALAMNPLELAVFTGEFDKATSGSGPLPKPTKILLTLTAPGQARLIQKEAQ